MTTTTNAPAQHDPAGIQALLSRAPGYAVAQKCLEVQAAAERRDPRLHTDKVRRLGPDAWSWYQGAVGEIEVGRLLATLGPEWFVRHSIPIGAGTTDVDHLLIGPAGVFALNTKHHRGQSVWVGDRVLRINNENRNHLGAARHEAEQVATRISRRAGVRVTVNSVIVVLGARSLVDQRALENRAPSVVPAEELIGWLTSLAPMLGETELALIRLAAEEPETWHIHPHAADTLRVMQRFERLQAAIEAPRDKRDAASVALGRPRRTPQRSASRSNRQRPDKRTSIVRPLIGVALLVALFVFREPVIQAYTALVTWLFDLFVQK